MGKVIITRVLNTEGYAIREYGTAFSKNDMSEIPNEGGVYALYWGETLQYIGRSKDLRKRLKNWEFKDHWKEENIPFGSCDWYVLLPSQVNDAEDFLIKYYQPPYNIAQR